MITWLGHASFRIEGSKIIYIDPWELVSDSPKADVILVTHSHYDHCSLEDVKKVCKSGSLVVAPGDCVEKLANLDVQVVAPGDSRVLNGVKIEVLPSYNVDKQFHPRSNNWVGYIVTLDGKRVYHAGDTDAIPEMKGLKIDTALLPVGGTYTMNAEEAAEAVGWMELELAIPMHWGCIVGSASDAELFKSKATCRVEVLNPSK